MLRTLILIVLSFAVLSCSRQGEVAPIRFAYPQTPIAGAALLMRKTEGDTGPRYRFSALPAARNCTDAVMLGSADFGISNEIVMAQVASTSGDVVILAVLAQSSGHARIVARRDREILTGKSLKGKKVGYFPGGVGEYIFDRLLGEHELGRSDVRIFNGQPAQLNAMLLDGQVDAIATWEPFATVLAEKGLATNQLELKREYTMSTVLIAKRSYAIANPGLVDEVLAKLQAHTHEMVKRSDNAKGAILSETQLSEAQLHKIWPLYNYDINLPSTILIPTLEEQIVWSERKSGRPAVRSVVDLIYDAPLLRLNGRSSR